MPERILAQHKRGCPDYDHSEYVEDVTDVFFHHDFECCEGVTGRFVPDFHDLPIEPWCFVNGLPAFACPDHKRHLEADARNDAGRTGHVKIVTVKVDDG